MTQSDTYLARVKEPRTGWREIANSSSENRARNAIATELETRSGYGCEQFLRWCIVWVPCGARTVLVDSGVV